MEKDFNKASDEIHAAGAHRHPQAWFTANRAAQWAARRYKFDMADARTAAMVATVVLRTLDVVLTKPSHGQSDRENRL